MKVLTRKVVLLESLQSTPNLIYHNHFVQSFVLNAQMPSATGCQSHWCQEAKISSKNNRSNFETLKTRIARLLCIIPRHKWCHWQFQFLKPVLHLIKYLFLTKALLSSRINSSIVTFVQSKSCKSFQNVSSILSSHRLLNFNLVQNNGMMQMQRQKSSVQK